MHTATTIAALRERLAPWRRAGGRIALVPTMGNLHAGHLHLVEAGRECADRVVVSVFVNPIQFGESEDYASYPRTLEEDARKLRGQNADLLFSPQPTEVYPEGSQTVVEVRELNRTLCGQFRPVHFDGVATVVCKLLNMAQPDVALFGEKDFQQLLVIRRMVADLNIPVEIVGVPTVRAADGLALSSRNDYLSASERRLAPALYRSLCAAKEAIEAGSRDFRQIEQVQLAVLRQAGFSPDYFSVRRRNDLLPAADQDVALVILAAAWLGRARLIDNVQLTAG
jgi:pantoate--beta-alanine ligase